MGLFCVYDLDHTLLNINSSFSFGIFLYRKKVLSFLKMLKLLYFYILHKLGIIQPAKLHIKAGKCFFQGQSIKTISLLVSEFLDLRLNQVLNPIVIEQFKKERNAGAYMVILSNSPGFIVSQIASRLKVNDWGATEYLVDSQGNISGVGTFMDGENKARYLNALMGRFKIEASRITAYTDSYLDLPMLYKAGNPVAVNPDYKLRRVCQLNCWKVLEN